MQQINLKTNYARKIVREVYYNQNGCVWKFKDGDEWNEYNPLIQPLLENYYEIYTNTGKDKFQFDLPSRNNEKYEIDFKNMTQASLKNNSLRNIKREFIRYN